MATSAFGWMTQPALAQQAPGNAALPQGGEVAAGSASLDYSQPGNLLVNQTTASSILNWNSFNVGSGNSVTFNQPDSHSATLNRVTGDTASEIAGSIYAPGTVLLVNPNGIAITQGAVVDVGSFVASGVDIADADFLSGTYTFRRDGRSGVVANHGTIRARDGGSVALIGAGVVNDGVIEARLGRVAFGAGDLVTLDFAGDGFLSVGLPVSELSDLVDANGHALSSLIDAGGAVHAEGGRIYLSAEAASSLMMRAINVPGDLIASSVSHDAQGNIVLEAGAGGATVTGNLSAGHIDVHGGNVALGGSLNADGVNGGAVNVASDHDLLLAGHTSARGSSGAGGAVNYSAGGQLIETSASVTDASGAQAGGAISVNADDILSSGNYAARGVTGAGGRIDVTGGNVTLASAHLDASGRSQGGLVRVGGAYQGGAGLAPASSVFLNDGVTINVSSSGGAGGTAIVWSQNETTMLGGVDARGQRGGGFVEVSSADTLRTVDLSRIVTGPGGTLLLDPKNIVIGDFATAQTWQYAALVGSAAGSTPPVSGLDTDDDFGISVALNATGNRMAVGSFLDDGFGNGQSNSGAVRLFTFTDSDFSGGALSGVIGNGYVGAGNYNVALDENDFFGVAVSLNAAGDRLAVGARRDDGAGNTTSDSGAVYLFTFTDTNFSGANLATTVGVGYGVNIALDSTDFFGNAVSLNAAGDRLAVGAYQDDGAGNAFTDSGAVYLINFTDTNFNGGTLAGRIGRGYTGAGNYDLGAALTANDWFGYAVSLNAAGDRLAVGAPQDDGAADTAADAGAVRLFSFTNTSFAGASLVSTIGVGYAGGSNLNLALDPTDLFGAAVALNAAGDILAVGAPQDDGQGNGATDVGAVRLFNFTNTNFGGGTLAATIGNGYVGASDVNVSFVPTSSNFGRSVALDATGARLAGGARGYGAAGSVLLFAGSALPYGAGFLFSDSPSSTVNLSRAALQATLSAGTNVTLQANNDITLNAGADLIVNNTSGNGGALTLQAGRSVSLNAGVTTDNGNLTIVANEQAAHGVVNAQRDAGAAAINISSVNAGTGAVHVTMSDGAGVANAAAGNVNVGTVTAGSVLVENAAANTGDIVLNGAVTASSGASPIVLAAGAGRVVNTFGAGVLDPGAGRFLIYALDPSHIVANGLTANPYYNTPYNAGNPGGVTGAGNRFAYVLAPTLLVTAGSGTRVYGDADPSLGYSITGLVGTDTLAGAVQGSATVVSTAAANAGVGNYATVASLGSLASDYNYGFSFANGNLAITPRTLQITADGQTRVYGDADPSLTYAITGGSLVFSDALTGGLTRDAGENVGSYAINQGTLTAGGNYTISYVGSNLVITPRALEITADGQSRIYGDLDPSLTYTISNGSLAFADTLSGALTRDAGENVGSYAITQGSLTAGSNYTVSYIGANLVITPRALQITADGQTRVYGDADPTLTYAITGGSLAFSDTLSGALVRDAGENVGGYAINQGSLTAGSNYTISYIGDNLLITPRALQITADGQSRVYGDADPTLTYAITGGSLAFSDALSGGLTRDAGENVGTYAITQGSLTAGGNYTISYIGANLAITPRALQITADGQTRIYGDLDPSLTYTITGGSLAFSDVLTGGLTRDAGENVGSYAINQGSLTAGANYTISYIGDSLVITPRALQITADGQTRIYGDADPSLAYTITGGSLAFTDALSGSLTRDAGENVGSYAINQGSLTGGGNYTISYIGANLVITPRTLQITADGQSRIYGDLDPSLTYAITGGSLAFTDTLSGGLVRDAGENVGSYAINQGSLTAGSNYTISYIGSNLEITPRSLQITADGQTRIYGDADPSLTYAITGGSLAFTDTLSGALTRATGENVGTYAINQGTLSGGSNYTISYIGANLVITPRALQITADGQSRIYGDLDPTLSYAITGGSLAFSDTLTGGLTRDAGENVGSYAINLGTLSAGSNYTISYIGSNLVITPRALQISADGQTRIYGDLDPSLSYAITGGSLAFSDTLSGGLARDAGENVGSYAINQGSLTAGSNYTITYIGSNLVITPRSLEITAGGQTRIYGDLDPSLTYAITGGSLAFSDTLSGSLTRDAGENVGSYAINQGTLTAGSNYAITYVGSDLVITPRSVQITANGVSRTYGNSDPGLTYAITGGSLAFSDTLSGALTRAAGENVGSYAITQGSLTGGANYTITYVGADLTITPRSLQITADDISKYFGDPDPTLTYAITGGSLVFGDTLSGLLVRTPGEAVGDYSITQGTLAN
ncbi:MAG TPA: MBG domain-containing protein [Vitreimonas sp.]|nr:MBG domain-containing protein [Vitreimonas sp.]